MPTLAGIAPWDALATLALAGRQATEIQLSTGDSIAYHQHLLTLARQALTCNAAGDGRLTLGLGVSHTRITAAAAAAGRPAPQVIASLPVMVTSDPDASRESIAAALRSPSRCRPTGPCWTRRASPASPM